MSIKIEGTQAQKSVVQGALTRCTFPLERLKGDVTIRFGDTPSRSDGGVSWAYAFPRRRAILVSPTIGVAKTEYVVIHELGHFVDHDLLDRPRRLELAALFSPPASKWREGATYRDKTFECYGDSFVKVFSDIRGILTGWYGRQVVGGVNLSKFREITLGQAMPVDVPEVPAPIVDELRGEIALLEAELATYKEIAAADLADAQRIVSRHW